MDGSRIVGLDLTTNEWSEDVKPELPLTGQVVRIDGSGVWVAELGSSHAHPIGPCRSAVPTHADPTTTAFVDEGTVVINRTTDEAYKPLKVGDIVLLVYTDQGPWVAGKDVS